MFLNVVALCVHVCTCVTPPLPSHIAREDADAFYEQVAWNEASDVFGGTVVRAEVTSWMPVNGDSTFFMDEGDPRLAIFWSWSLRPIGFRYTLRVSDVWKGTVGRTVVVTVSKLGTCVRMLTLGESYIIYGSEERGAVPISRCNRTVRRGDANLELEAMARRRAVWQ